MFKHKYFKYKSKYTQLKMKGGNIGESLFAFIVDSLTYDTQIIIVKATDENGAYDELNNMTKKKIFSQESQFSKEIDMDELIQHIYDKGIKPIKVNPPFYFSFYNG